MLGRVAHSLLFLPPTHAALGAMRTLGGCLLYVYELIILIEGGDQGAVLSALRPLGGGCLLFVCVVVSGRLGAVFRAAQTVRWVLCAYSPGSSDINCSPASTLYTPAGGFLW